MGFVAVLVVDGTYLYVLGIIEVRHEADSMSSQKHSQL